MRPYIANITTYKEEQIEVDSAREDMRQNLIKQYRIDRAARQNKKHAAEIIGKNSPSGAILDLFDDDGNAPVNITQISLKKQYKRMAGQLRWVMALSEELHRELEKIDPTRYHADQKIIQDRDHDLAQKKEEIYQKFISRIDQDQFPKLRKAMRDTLQSIRNAREMKQFVKRSVTDIRVIGVRQVEKALQYLFADYVIARDGPALDASARYDLIRKELDWLEINAVEINNKLCSLYELLQSGQAYLESQHWN